MGQENRRQRRLAIQLDAKAEAPGIVWRVRIRNFCGGGLFLEYHSTQGSLQAGFRRPMSGEKLVIAFHTPSRDSPQLNHIACKVAHVDDGGFGVQFLERKEEAIRGLLIVHRRQLGDLHKATKSATDRPSPAQVKGLLARIGELLEQRLIAATPETFVQMSGLLMAAGQRASEASDQAAYRRARAELEAEREEIISGWLDCLCKGVARIGVADAPQDTPEEITLVDERSFDEWVAAVGLASRLQADLGEPLYALEQRLSELARASITRENNPLDPSAFVMAFVESVERLNFDLATQRLLLGGLGNGLRPMLEALYQEVNQLLIQAGIIPKLSMHGYKPAASPPPDKKKEGSGAVVKTPERSGGGGKAQERISRTPFSRLSAIFKPRQRNASQGQEGEAGAPPAPAAAVGDALRRLGGDGGALSLKERVRSALRQQGEQGELRVEEEGALDASESLVSALREDAKIHLGIGDLVGKLDVPLARVALEDPDFLSDTEHPAAGFMADLERLSVAMSGDAEGGVQARQLQQVIEETLGSLSEDGGQGAEAFAAARAQLAPHVERVERQVETNVKRLVETREGEERLTGAKQQVAEELNRVIGDQPVSKALVQLILLGWDNLLVLTLLHQGEEDCWREYLGAFEIFAEWLRAGRLGEARYTPEQMLTIIAKGFEETPLHQIKQQKLVQLLERAFANPKLFKRIAEDLIDYHYHAKDAHPPLPPPDPATEKRLAPMVETIRGINQGDWLVERKPNGISRPLSLVWRDALGDRFSFVDGKGLRALDSTVYELAERFERAELSILEDGGLPLVQRAVQDVLQKTYDQLLHNSETDELTGLFNRRRFTRELTKLVEGSRNHTVQHVMLLVDIDQFKLTNDICGHEGGDRLLVETASILRTFLGGDAILGRLGDDEFGVLLSYCAADDGLEMAEKQRRAMENYTFNWDGRKLTPTVSIGMVAFNDASVEASDLLQRVDSACHLAKKAGRNEVKAYQAEDRELAQHKDGLMAATMVEEAIQQGKLRLFVQRITPVFMDDDLEDHYEVLLRIVDENGVPGSPEAFIKVAEENQRMRSIDRWVIEAMFGWLERNNDRLDGIGGFSINLSGQSVDDEQVIAFVTEKLSATSYPPERISFEITETAMIGDMGRARELILGIKELGCQFYLDDFGSGLASYSYLKDLPVDCVKIDGSFVKNIAHDENDFALVKSITETAHFMKKRVIAEYVTNESIMVRLRELEVDYAQGYQIGKPFDLSTLLV